MIVLACVAHPDDEVVGSGGTLARLAKEGHEVHVAIMGIRHLETEARHACMLLGVKQLHTMDLPDQRFDSVDLLDVIQKVEAVLAGVQPEIVYTNHTHDLNHDHAITAKAVLVATRPKEECCVKSVLMFEIPETTGWGFNYQFHPSVFMDVSGFMATKREAMACYPSEVKPWPHPRSAEALQVTSRHWGSVVGLQHAEAFQLVRSIR
jgi:LmbE family N-acetylglucosaminyl deacetylase